ncbi:beta-lactamase [Myxococcus stipitatus DSM 14675]|uniref:Beta-lactamase n=1 Tax=Myxococcus stipitatus (strain DSM 14675 / JCM 12634 / Mx s8) TaxID=1278073 RepID=L7UKZ0_MYXSD|nr:serine hydrolase domain-containing protein [Myxococcus stipitatus]AGC47114.1 beta-lactamase [Myxococcus stipitatus DSM 14675]
MSLRSRLSWLVPLLLVGCGTDVPESQFQDTSPPSSHSETLSAEDLSRVSTGDPLQQLLEAEHAAGMPGAFAEVWEGTQVWRGAVGVADVETGRPMRPGFRHRVGSLTKSFVSTAVLQLVGEGRIQLDAPIGASLPDVVPGELGTLVTVRMLLNHTSGLGDYPDAILVTPEDFESVRRRTFTPRELVAYGLALPPTDVPGKRYSYSNTNYILAGLLIERVTGRSLEDVVERRILRPLGLHDTYFPGTRMHVRGAHSKAYVPWADGTLRDFSVYNMSWGWAAGALVSTPRDINRFYQALLGGRLLAPAQLAEMLTPVLTHPKAGYGLGLSYSVLDCGPVWGHTGGLLGHRTFTFHRADGSRRVTLAENLTRYETPGQPHPINQARTRFIVTALCGPSAASSLEE